MFGTHEHKVLLDIVGELNTKICCTVIGWLFRRELDLLLEVTFPEMGEVCFQWLEFVGVAGTTSLVAAYLEVELKALRARLVTSLRRGAERDRMEDRLMVLEAINRALPLIPTWSFKEIVEQHAGIFENHVAMYALLVLTICALLVAMLHPSVAFTERKPKIAAFRKVFASSFALGAAFAMYEVPKTMIKLILGNHSTHLAVLAILAPLVTLAAVVFDNMISKLKVPEEERFCHAFIMFLMSAGKFIAAWQWAALFNKLKGYMLAEVESSCGMTVAVHIFWAMMWLDLGTLVAWRFALGCGFDPDFEYELEHLHVSGGSALAVLVVGICVGWSVTSVLKAGQECLNGEWKPLWWIIGWFMIAGMSVLMVWVQRRVKLEKNVLQDEPGDGADEDEDGKPAP